MNFLLTAVNAKYIHSNPAVHFLKAYADSNLDGNFKIDIAEYTINNLYDDVIQDIYLRKPDFIGFSCYIWNIEYIIKLVNDIRTLLPEIPIWLGGPESTNNAEKIISALPAVTGIMLLEGEETFTELCRYYISPDKVILNDISGIAFRSDDGIIITSPRELLSMDDIPCPYTPDTLCEYNNKIIYYESSRGCPFSCSYCLSSLDKTVRFRSTEIVKKELAMFLDANVSQVKFVDRTYNCDREHTMEIWKFIREHDNGITNFHFEISADLLNTEEIELLGSMRPGLVQLEIGVQTVNTKTIKEIKRKMNFNLLRENVMRIEASGNIHVHLDLIAGLPFEDMASFKNSFNEIYAMRPHQLQLGFLKVLAGSYMAAMSKEYGIKYKSSPPYEVLETKWLSYENIIELKMIEDMIDVYYNSGQYINTINELSQKYESAYDMFYRLACYYKTCGYFGANYNRLKRYEILYDFICFEFTGNGHFTLHMRDMLMYDLYLRENVKSRPKFAPDMTIYKDIIRKTVKQKSSSVHAEVISDGTILLFDYTKKEPMYGNAYVTKNREWI